MGLPSPMELLCVTLKILKNGNLVGLNKCVCIYSILEMYQSTDLVSDRGADLDNLSKNHYEISQGL